MVLISIAVQGALIFSIYTLTKPDDASETLGVRRSNLIIILVLLWTLLPLLFFLFFMGSVMTTAIGDKFLRNLGGQRNDYSDILLGFGIFGLIITIPELIASLVLAAIGTGFTIFRFIKSRVATPK